MISCCSSKTIGNKLTLSFLGVYGLLGTAVFLGLSKVYINQPITPMNMSAGKSIMTSPLLRLRFLETNFAPI
jgi:hypothetical protein